MRDVHGREWAASPSKKRGPPRPDQRAAAGPPHRFIGAAEASPHVVRQRPAQERDHRIEPVARAAGERQQLVLPSAGAVVDADDDRRRTILRDDSFGRPMRMPAAGERALVVEDVLTVEQHHNGTLDMTSWNVDANAAPADAGNVVRTPALDAPERRRPGSRLTLAPLPQERRPSGSSAAAQAPSTGGALRSVHPIHAAATNNSANAIGPWNAVWLT